MQVNVLTRVAHPANQVMALPRRTAIPRTNESAVLRGSRDHFIQSQFDYMGATPDAEYDLRFDADENYLRELIDRIDGMSLRGVKLCNRCTEKHPGKWQGKLGRGRSARTAIGMLSDILFCIRLRLWRGGRAAVSSKADERELDRVISAQEELDAVVLRLEMALR